MTEGGMRIVTVEPDADTYRVAYDVISNATLWFLHHMLFDLTRRPRFDHHWFEAWNGYREFNEQFADCVARIAASDATVLVQDYHLALLPAMLAVRRPDLRIAHFSHTPFADANAMRVLPESAARQLLEGMSAGACGFHTARWRDNFLSSCADAGVRAPPTFVAPLAPDAQHLAQRSASPACTEALRRVEALVGSHRVVLRVDRMEPSKNLLRGFWAFDELLRQRPDLRGTVVMLALAYTSRQTLPDYLAYGTEVEVAARRVNDTWGTDGWTPVILDVADDADRSFAALTHYDVLLVNPLRDGLNLVAQEGPLVNRTAGVLVLSREAGSFDVIGAEALAVNPFDVSSTAAALEQALDMGSEERSRRAAALRALVVKRTPAEWLDDQLQAATRPSALST